MKVAHMGGRVTMPVASGSTLCVFVLCGERAGRGDQLTRWS